MKLRKIKVEDIDVALSSIPIASACGITLQYDHSSASKGFWIFNQNNVKAERLTGDKRKACAAFNRAVAEASRLAQK